MTDALVIYTDGGARGNPGPAAIGVIVGGEGHKEYIGETTNNVAEYQAVIVALRLAKKKLGVRAKKTAVEVRLDSELIQRQLIGRYRVKEARLKLLHAEATRLQESFKEVAFHHIRRAENAEADRLVNEALDERK